MEFTQHEVACRSFVACLSFVCQIACRLISSILRKTFVSIYLEMPFVCRFVCRFSVGWRIAYVLEEFFPFLAYELEKSCIFANETVEDWGVWYAKKGRNIVR